MGKVFGDANPMYVEIKAKADAAYELELSKQDRGGLEKQRGALEGKIKKLERKLEAAKGELEEARVALVSAQDRFEKATVAPGNVEISLASARAEKARIDKMCADGPPEPKGADQIGKEWLVSLQGKEAEALREALGM